MRLTSRLGPFSLALIVALAGCAPRQAVVGTDSSPRAGTRQQDRDILVQELGRLAEAQDQYRSTNPGYADNLSRLNFTPRGGIRLDVLQGDQNGFSALASIGSAECAIFSGSVRPPRSYVSVPGRAACRS